LTASQAGGGGGGKKKGKKKKKTGPARRLDRYGGSIGPNRAPSCVATCLGLATPLKLPQSYDRFITSYRPKTPVAAVPAADGAKED
jgi:hypothetical protein